MGDKAERLRQAALNPIWRDVVAQEQLAHRVGLAARLGTRELRETMALWFSPPIPVECNPKPASYRAAETFIVSLIDAGVLVADGPGRWCLVPAAWDEWIAAGEAASLLGG